MNSLEALRDLARGRIPWRTNLILIPGAIVFACLLLFILTQSLDIAHANGSIRLPAWIDQGGASDCRDLVSATAGAIITTLGLVLSITVLIFSMAATQFGQRLLRRYMRDKGTQISIGIFAATFVFSMLTLLSVTSRPNEPEYTPWVSAWTSLLLAMSCVAVLIYFVHHVALLIQVSTVLADIRGDISRVLKTMRGPETKPLSSVAELLHLAPEFALPSPGTGYLQRFDHDELIAAAKSAGVTLEFLKRPGHFTLEGSVLALARRTSGAPVIAPTPALSHAFRDSVILGPRRTMRQDPKFAILQITEIGLRAMSPAVNDPFTMIMCIDSLAASLRSCLVVPPLDPVYADENGTPRIIEPEVNFPKLLDAGFDPVRQVCVGSVATTLRIFEALTSLAPFCKEDDQLHALDQQTDLTKELFPNGLASRDQDDLHAAYAHAKQAIGAARLSLSPAK